MCLARCETPLARRSKGPVNGASDTFPGVVSPKGPGPKFCGYGTLGIDPARRDTSISGLRLVLRALRVSPLLSAHTSCSCRCCCKHTAVLNETTTRTGTQATSMARVVHEHKRRGRMKYPWQDSGHAVKFVANYVRTPPATPRGQAAKYHRDSSYGSAATAAPPSAATPKTRRARSV